MGLKFVILCNLPLIMENPYNRSHIIFTDTLREEIRSLIKPYPSGKVYLSTETTVESLWLKDDPFWQNFPGVVIPAGEENKKLQAVEKIWEFLSRSGADRKSLLINVGGGMLTDLSGFAASTFKRGMSFINVPTTLLAQVDASVGGKTGFNFNGLKNEIGTFREPDAVLIDTQFLRTLDNANFRSGYAEMIKHGLIFSPEHLEELIAFDTDHIDYTRLQEMVQHSVEVKKHFVEHDPFEKNIRKALNFGHTAGHAIESLAMERGNPVLHGFAVAWGMLAELTLSVQICGFPAEEAWRISSWIRDFYGDLPLTPDDFPLLWEIMRHDKKNENNLVNFTLLSGTGKYEIDRTCSRELVMEALNYINLKS